MKKKNIEKNKILKIIIKKFIIFKKYHLFFIKIDI